jgi:hypothetical protein
MHGSIAKHLLVKTAQHRGRPSLVGSICRVVRGIRLTSTW